MMRVLMTADAVGGVWTYTLQLARALASRDVFTTLAVMGPAPSDDQLADAFAIPQLWVVVNPLKLEWMDEPWADVRSAGDWLLGIEERLNPSVIHLNGYAHGNLPWRAPAVIVGHSCLSSWSEAVGADIDPVKLASYRGRVAQGLQAADWIVAPSAAMLSMLDQHYGPFDHASVVANGRGSSDLQSSAKEPFVFAAGRLWDRAKNLELLTSVARELPWPVAIAGGGALGGASSEADASSSDDSCVRRLGRLPRAALAQWLGRAPIFALPAVYEPFGLLPLEAALSGCALVLGDIPSLREVWGDAADFVDPRSPDALRNQLERLINSPEQRRARAAAAYRRALHYSPDRMAAAYLDVYQRVQSHPADQGKQPCTR